MKSLIYIDVCHSDMDIIDSILENAGANESNVVNIETVEEEEYSPRTDDFYTNEFYRVWFWHE